MPVDGLGYYAGDLLVLFSVWYLCVCGLSLFCVILGWVNLGLFMPDCLACWLLF